MSIEEIIEARGLSEVVHFTTNRGVLGVLDSRALKPRSMLADDTRLEFIYTPNAARRPRDVAWHGHVNLSISKPNTSFLQIATGWHRPRGFWWCVLSFSPEILTHDGVVFATSNNIWQGCVRQPGADGLDGLFATAVSGAYGRAILRPTGHPANLPTSEQAEVLYPGPLSTRFLQRIYVNSPEVEDELVGQIALVSHATVPVVVDPALFRDTP